MRQYPVREIREAINTRRDVTEESPTLDAVVSGCHGKDSVWQRTEVQRQDQHHLEDKMSAGLPDALLFLAPKDSLHRKVAHKIHDRVLLTTIFHQQHATMDDEAAPPDNIASSPAAPPEVNDEESGGGSTAAAPSSPAAAPHHHRRSKREKRFVARPSSRKMNSPPDNNNAAEDDAAAAKLEDIEGVMAEREKRWRDE